MKIAKFPQPLATELKEIEQKAYSYLVVGDFQKAEQEYKRQYEILKSKEHELAVDEKYHKGGPLHNWGISLILQNNTLEGFRKITLAYIEDLLNFSKLEDAFEAPAYKTLKSYPLISSEFLDKLKALVKCRREENRVPRDPEDIVIELRAEGFADLSSTFTAENLEKAPLAIDQLRPLIQDQLERLGPKDKRVFVGGSYKNIAVLRYIKSIVEDVDDFKAVIPLDLPKLSSEVYDHLAHDTSIEYLKGCSYAIFEVSMTNGHLMEIERAHDETNLKVLLIFQKTRPQEEPTITRMLMTTDFKKIGYGNLTELTIEIGKFLAS